MAYYDSDPQQTHSHAAIFLHGQPTSSFLWRNVLPHVTPVARCIAPDFLGHGRTDKRANHSYRWVADHYKYLCALLDSLNLPSKITIVGHDWGAVIGLHYAQTYPDRVEGVVHIESLIRPSNPDWDLWPQSEKHIYQELRSPAGDQLQLQENAFVEKRIPPGMFRKLSEDEFNAYREPFRNPGEDRRPPLTTVRQVPVEGDGPEDVIEAANAYYKWFRETKIPKLYIDCQPGFFSIELRKMAEKKFFPNQDVVAVRGIHYPHEDSPDEMGQAICQFLTNKVFT